MNEDAATTREGGVANAPLPGKLLRIGELAKRTNKTVRALHLYEELGLLHPAHRSRGGFRLYHVSSVERVEWIAKLQGAGFSLAAIQDFLRGVFFESVAPEAMSRVRGVFESKLDEISQARERLERLEQDLRAALAYLDGCRACTPTRQSSDCPGCSINGHGGAMPPPTLVAGIHTRT